MSILDIIGLVVGLATPVVTYLVGRKHGGAAVKVTPLGPQVAKINDDIDAAGRPTRVPPPVPEAPGGGVGDADR